MSDIKNAGGKGYCLLVLLVSLALFTWLVLYLYFYNGKFLPS